MNVIKDPTLAELSAISHEYGLACTDEELHEYQEILKHSIEDCRRVSELPEPMAPVKYPRTSGHRPEPFENPYNAWYWQCSIRGAEKGKLSGLTVAIKDNVCVAGVPMMNGSRTLEGYVPEQDATVITRLLDEGAHVVGKSTVEDLCLSGASYMTTHGPVRNPWNTDHSAGGSSSGSAVLVARKEVDLATGGDQGGSIRIPASCCGIVGLKPTYGLVPYTGIMPIETSVDHVGPMARTVKECALMLEVMAGFDQNADCRQPSMPFPCPLYTQEIEKPTESLKIGVLQEGFELSTPEVIATVRKAVDALKISGKFACVEEVSVPRHLDGEKIWASIGIVGLTHQMVDGHAFGTGLSGQHVTSLSEKFRQGMNLNARSLSHSSKLCILLGSYLKHHYGLSIYGKAQSLALDLRRKYDEQLNNYDVLLMPTLPQSPCHIPDDQTPLSEGIANAFATLANTAPFNMTHHPALSLNAGFGAESNLPIGLMVVGRLWQDATVLRVAHAAETLLKPMQTRSLF